MSSHSGASIAPPSWGSAVPVTQEARPRLVPLPSAAGARWGIRGRAALDAAAGAALLATTAGLWIAFLISVW